MAVDGAAKDALVVSGYTHSYKQQRARIVQEA